MILKSYKVHSILFLLFLLTGQILLAESGDQNIQLELRSIGHHFLTKIGDTTSRVLPLEHDGDTYIMSFERAFSFDPDLLVRTVLNKLQSNDEQVDYLVEVLSCSTNKIVHSFTTKENPIPNEVACVGRKLPQDCYEFHFSTQTFTSKDSSHFISKNAIPISALLLLSVGFVGVYFYSKRKEPLAEDQTHLQIGQYEFDPKTMNLTYRDETISLSGKESELLLLLHTQMNEIVTREEILDKVWDDDGNYVGRTLDVYISKLRKKLEADPSIQIINVRGVGYKMVVG